MRKIPAAFIRGGTSKGVFFHQKDLPVRTDERDDILLKILGSPDPYERQLNGMGGGYSSVSKAVIISPSSRDDADIDYTFAQVSVTDAIVDYSSNCGNLSSAVGPFAVDEGLIKSNDGECCVRIFNTNTEKLFTSHFEVKNNKAINTGDFRIAGVASSGATIRLEFHQPDGAATGKLLPSGNLIDEIKLADKTRVKCSLIDSSNAVVFVHADELGVDIKQTPEQIESDSELMQQLENIRKHAGVMMGMAKHVDDVSAASPKIALLASPENYQTIGGVNMPETSHDIQIRMVSMGRIHKAVTLTGAMCLATASQLPGSIPHQIISQIPESTSTPENKNLNIASPSGVIPVSADINLTNNIHSTVSTTVYRTQRRLMDGFVYID